MNVFPIEGFDYRYLVGEDGRIFDREKKRFLKQSKGGRGYLTVRLNEKTYYVHKIIAQAFIFKPEGKDCVSHIDGNKMNNKIENLEWCTKKESIQNSIERGALKPGEATKKKVRQYTTEGEFVAEYESINEAARAVNRSGASIGCAIRGRSKTCAGFIWRKVEKD